MTKEQLRQHRRMIHELRLEMRQLIDANDEMRARATRCTPRYSTEPAGGGHVHDPIAEMVARVADKDREIAWLDLQRDQLAGEIEAAIRCLTPLERGIMRAYYIECMEWGRVAMVWNYSEATIYKIHGRALQSIGAAKVYSQVESKP